MGKSGTSWTQNADEIDELSATVDGMKTERDRLRAENAHLRDALRDLIADCTVPRGFGTLAPSREVMDSARAALARA